MCVCAVHDYSTKIQLNVKNKMKIVYFSHISDQCYALSLSLQSLHYIHIHHIHIIVINNLQQSSRSSSLRCVFFFSSSTFSSFLNTLELKKEKDKYCT